VSFRPGVIPPLAHLEQPFQDKQVETVVKRVDPLSLQLRQIGPVPLAATLIDAFVVLGRAIAREARGN